MIQFLLKFLGVKIDAAQEVSSVSLQLRHSSWLGWMVFIAVLLSIFVWGVYRYIGGHRDLKAPRRRLLTVLRVILILLLLFILLRPVVSFTIENRLRRALVVLVDKSASMNIQDTRMEETDVKRAAIAKGLIDKLDQSVDQAHASALQHVSRTELVKSAFENKELSLIDTLKKRYNVEFVGFNRGVTPESQEQALQQPPPDDDSSQATAIGDAVRDIINRKRGQPIAGILMVTDGASNTGSEPLDAANAAAQDRMPLYIYGVGITSPRDIIVDSVFTPDVVFIKDEVPVTVRVRSQGLKGEKAHLTLKLDDQEIASKDLVFEQDGELAVPLTFTPQKAGEFNLTASIPARDDETVKDNNTASQRLRVIDSKIKILYLEQGPRWEFRYLQNVLLRDRRIDAKFLLVQSDPALSSAAGSPFLSKFPATKEDLFKYDLVIIGDVDPHVLTPEQMDNLSEFVSKFGGAIAFIAGQQYDPVAYLNTPFEKLLPIEMDGSMTRRNGPERATTLALTSAGRTSPMLRLSPNEQENAEIWHRFPPIQWINRVSRAKPGAQVLLEDQDPVKITRFGKMPAMALQQYGVGQVLYIGTDNTWRWRQETGVAYYPLLWGQIIQRMALPHLLGGSKRTQLSVDKQNYGAGERVTVFARLYDQAFQPVKQPSVNGNYATQPGPGQPFSAAQRIQLRPLPDQPGMYRGDFVAVSPGNYKFYVESDPQTNLQFEVTKPRFELGETAMNAPLLKEMARISGGAFFREEDLGSLTHKLSQQDERITRVLDADIWSSPFYFGLVTVLATVEWIMRKRSELK